MNVGDVELFVQLQGDGPPLLFVHGFPLSGDMWLPTVERLGTGWRSIIPDLRGHGRSGVSPAASIAGYADDLARLLNGLNENRPVVLIGLSMGGIVAFEFFRRHRTRLRALVLCDTRTNAETPEGAAVREQTAQSALREGAGAVVDAMMPKLFAPGAPAELKEHWRRAMSATPPLGVAAAARALAARADSTPTLPEINLPTLIVYGLEDAITAPQIGREMHAKIRSSRLELIHGAGHVPPVETPDAFAAILAGFLRSL
ncbi:AB hydrolase superfamily protein YdjP [Phycisphaerae bacterium RAS1]|nr:AB hydrolase superfamily protein YdjP [Phycisphaerae bacterium RAS1]